jgi:hypothetical protein
MGLLCKNIIILLFIIMVKNSSMESWIDKFVRRTQGIRPRPVVSKPDIPKPVIPKQNLRMLIILKSDNSLISVNFCNFIVNNGFVSKNIDVYRLNPIEESNLVNQMQRFYDLGYRVFISAQDSAQFKSLFDWLNSRNDVIYINMFSTVANDSFISSIPSNSFRTSTNDFNSLKTLLYEIIPNFKYALVPNGNIELHAPLINTKEGDMPFKYIVYIYEPSLYTTSYRDNIQTIINNYDFAKEVIFVPIELDMNTNTLPDEAIYYLTFNNASNSKFLTSTERPIILLNTLTPQSLLDRFTEKNYYDNYFVTGDPFPENSYKSRFKFKYAFSLIPNFSNIGYKLSRNVDPTQSISPQILNIYNVCSELGSLFNENISTNETFVASKLLEKLNMFNYVENKQWYDQYLTMLYVTYENEFYISEENFITYDLAIIKHQWNPDTYVVAVGSDYTLSYDDMTFTEPLLTYSQNLAKINNYKPNVVTILDDDYDLFYLSTDFNKFKSFLSNHYTRDFPEKLFAKYYRFNVSELYNIPIIRITLPPITGYVMQNIYHLQLAQNTIDPVLKLTIPEFSYDRVSFHWSKETSQYDPVKEMPLTTIIKPSFDVTLTDAVKEFILIFYNGNQVRIINTNGDEEQVEKTVQCYVKVNVTVNWLVIKKKYVIGDVVTRSSNNRRATIKGVSENFFNLTIQYNDNNSIEDVTQDDVNPIGILNEINVPVFRL